MEWIDLGVSLCYVVLGAVILMIAKFVNDLLTPYSLDEELTVRDNPAIGLSLSGYYAGVMIVFLGASTGTEGDLLNLDRLLPELGVVAAYALGGILLLNLGRKLLDKLVLRQFSIYKELVQDRNVGTGAVLCGAYIATALILAGGIYGEIPPESAFAGAWTGPITAVCYFLAGQVTLILFSIFYQWITRYDIHAEIEKDNPAAGVAFGGNMVALGILLLKASAPTSNPSGPASPNMPAWRSSASWPSFCCVNWSITRCCPGPASPTKLRSTETWEPPGSRRWWPSAWRPSSFS